jgi:hypothetical protein
MVLQSFCQCTSAGELPDATTMRRMCHLIEGHNLFRYLARRRASQPLARGHRFTITVAVVRRTIARLQRAFRRLPTSEIILAPRLSRAIPASDVALQHHHEYLIVMETLYIANRFPHTFTPFGEIRPLS